MPLRILFWVIFVVAILFFGWLGYSAGPYSPHLLGGSVVTMVLIGILGWKVFGPAVQG
jgi:hypothetical protein